MKPIISVLLLPFGMLLSGCVAWEIRDEVRTANGQLCETNRQLTDVQAGLTVTNVQLAEMYGALQRTDARLTAANALLEVAHPKLTTLDDDLTRMRIIDEVSVSLKDVQKTLVPLAKSLGMVSSAANFLGMGGGGNQDLLADEPAAGAVPTTEGAAMPAASSATTTTTTPATPAPTAPADKRLDALVGTWVIVYPPPQPPQRMGKVMVITTDGKYLESQEGGPITTGHWSRTGRTVTIESGAMKESGELLAATPRALTLRFGDSLRVYARP